ncbi:MAG: HlyD family secretion protein, partial [Myroides sp.]
MLKRNLILSFNQLKKAVAEWEINYVLKSSTSGKISFQKIWAEQQNVSTGENAFVVIPNQSSNYIGRLKVSSFNSGKIKVGQNVNIRLANYPDREFGIIKGKVKLISLVPDTDNNLLIDVELPQGLKTSYSKKIAFQ